MNSTYTICNNYVLIGYCVITRAGTMNQCSVTSVVTVEINGNTVYIPQNGLFTNFPADVPDVVVMEKIIDAGAIGLVAGTTSLTAYDINGNAITLTINQDNK